MAYLSTEFEHDIFISYVHDNNLPLDRGKAGWVTQFHDDLVRELKGSLKDVDIWRDKELNSNTLFDQRIQQVVNRSALFIAITSKRYLISDYCRQELAWFYSKAKQERWKLDINGEYRIFNVLMHNVLPADWPKEFQQEGNRTSGLPFYDDLGKELEQDEEMDNGKTYRRSVRKLAVELETLLVAFKKKIEVEKQPPPPPPPSPSFKVFFAHSSTKLDTERERLATEIQPELKELRLTARAIEILNPVNDIPPPYEVTHHDQAVAELLAQADLVVHLLNGDPGIKVDVKGAETFIQRQVELSMQYARAQNGKNRAAAQRQLVWLPKPLETKNPNHQEFLDRLVQQTRPSTYRIINDTFDEFRRVLCDTIVEQVSVLETPPSPPQSNRVLLSYDPNDKSEYWKIGPILEAQYGLQLLTEPEAVDKEEKEAVLKKYLAQVRHLFLIFGASVNDEWLTNKLFELMKLVSSQKNLPKSCGIYLPPSRSKSQTQLFFPFSTKIIFVDNNDIADHASFKTLLDLA